MSTQLPPLTEYLCSGVLPLSATRRRPTENSECSICCEKFNNPGDNSVILLTDCGHFFHTICISAWFTGTHQRRGSCPNCRRELFEPDRLVIRETTASYQAGGHGFGSTSNLNRNDLQTMVEAERLQTLNRPPEVPNVAQTRNTGVLRSAWDSGSGESAAPSRPILQVYTELIEYSQSAGDQDVQGERELLEQERFYDQFRQISNLSRANNSRAQFSMYNSASEAESTDRPMRTLPDTSNALGTNMSLNPPGGRQTDAIPPSNQLPHWPSRSESREYLAAVMSYNQRSRHSANLRARYGRNPALLSHREELRVADERTREASQVLNEVLSQRLANVRP